MDIGEEQRKRRVNHPSDNIRSKESEMNTHGLLRMSLTVEVDENQLTGSILKVVM